jgi:hypothetical protein
MEFKYAALEMEKQAIDSRDGPLELITRARAWPEILTRKYHLPGQNKVDHQYTENRDWYILLVYTQKLIFFYRIVTTKKKLK